MKVAEIVEALGLEVLSGADLSGREVFGGYTSDLLSCVMAGATKGDVWVTLQSHQNVVAVASLTEVACVILSEGARPDNETLKRAEQEGVILLSAQQDSFTIVAALARMGVEA